MVYNHKTHTSFGIIYASIFVIKNLINYNNLIDYINFIIENIIIETMINLDTRVFAVKMVMSLVLEVIKIDEDNIYREMTLI